MSNTLLYHSGTGETYLDGQFEGIGYSGTLAYRNKPEAEDLKQLGPIPRGRYTMSLCDPKEHPHLASPVFRLTPKGHDAFKRTGFLLHGDNTKHDASHGCIIEGRTLRQHIAAEKVEELWVV